MKTMIFLTQILTTLIFNPSFFTPVFKYIESLCRITCLPVLSPSGINVNKAYTTDDPKFIKKRSMKSAVSEEEF